MERDSFEVRLRRNVAVGYMLAGTALLGMGLIVCAAELPPEQTTRGGPWAVLSFLISGIIIRETGLRELGRAEQEQDQT